MGIGMDKSFGLDDNFLCPLISVILGRGKVPADLAHLTTILSIATTTTLDIILVKTTMVVFLNWETPE